MTENRDKYLVKYIVWSSTPEDLEAGTDTFVSSYWAEDWEHANSQWQDEWKDYPEPLKQTGVLRTMERFVQEEANEL